MLLLFKFGYSYHFLRNWANYSHLLNNSRSNYYKIFEKYWFDRRQSYCKYETKK